MKALSIRNPWAWYIIHAGKTVENRGTRWAYRGPVLIHVGASLTRDEYRAWREAGEAMRSDAHPRPKLPEYGDMLRGGFVGIVRITDCVEHPNYGNPTNSKGWRMGSEPGSPTFGYGLADARVLPFVPAKGALGIYDVEHTPGGAAVPRSAPYRVDFGTAVAAYEHAWRHLASKLR